MNREKLVARRTKLKGELALLAGEREELAARRAGRRRVAAVLVALAFGLPAVVFLRDADRSDARIVPAVAASVLLLGTAAVAALRTARPEREHEAALAARVRAVVEETCRIDGKLERAGVDVSLPLAERRAQLEEELAVLAAEAERLALRIGRWHAGREMTRILTAPLLAAALVGVLLVKAYASLEAATTCALVLVAALGWAAWQDRRRLVRQADDVRSRTRALEAVIRGIAGGLSAPGPE